MENPGLVTFDEPLIEGDKIDVLLGSDSTPNDASNTRSDAFRTLGRDDVHVRRDARSNAELVFSKLAPWDAISRGNQILGLVETNLGPTRSWNALRA